MNWLLRPSLLLFISIALAVSAAVLMYWTPAVETRPEPKPVAEGDQEIVFLYQATNASTWQRFVAAAEQLDGWRGFHVDLGNAFPLQTTTVPEVIVSSDTVKGRLFFRWYKLTSMQRVSDWADALLRRSPPPLAIIGGNTSDAAWEQAKELKRAAQQLPEQSRPLLLLTTATAQRVGAPDDPLMKIYAGRTFRFCFTNRQMAEAVAEFLDSQDALRIDTQHIYTVAWDDDSYSGDLTANFGMALRGRRAAEEVLVAPQIIDSSVGMFDRPNEMETQRADWLVKDYHKNWGPGRYKPLLVVAGQSQPSRRFLRALNLNLAWFERRFIVATGDTIAFNTVYRDRDIAWPIQDLPFPLIFFCHRNPVSSKAGFQPDPSNAQGGSSSSSGTEDLLLFKDIVRALLHTAVAEGALLADTRAIGRRLSALRKSDVLDDPIADAPLFDEDGNRCTGTGEHVVWLDPAIDDEEHGNRVLPKATIRVFARQVDGATGERWQKRNTLEVLYEGAAGGMSHGGD
jgi:hypothetical protein